MRSPRSVVADLKVGLYVLCATLTITASAVAAQPVGRDPRSGPAITDAQIVRALEQVKTDPNLATQKTITTLKWRQQPGSFEWPAWIKWLGHLVAWMDQSVRGLIWVTIAIFAGLLGIYLRRVFAHHEGVTSDGRLVAPTHVQDLDIRPESLPADIGQAARALWDRGDHRAALALLYRGLLSRLAHVHHVPIRDSSTEGDCVALAAAHLAADRREYVRALVGVWQRAGYGHEEARTPDVYALCEAFAPTLDSASAGTAS